MKTLREVAGFLRRGYNVVPLVRSVPADTLTPVSSFLRVARRGEDSFLLESVEGGERMARYSFLGASPFETLSVRGGKVLRDRGAGPEACGGHPFFSLGERLRAFRAPREPGLPRFCGGAVGFVDTAWSVI